MKNKRLATALFLLVLGYYGPYTYIAVEEGLTGFFPLLGMWSLVTLLLGIILFLLSTHFKNKHNG